MQDEEWDATRKGGMSQEDAIELDLSDDEVAPLPPPPPSTRKSRKEKTSKVMNRLYTKGLKKEQEGKPVEGEYSCARVGGFEHLILTL
jgi:hypothetical protein